MTAARTPLLLAFRGALIPAVSQAREWEVPVTRDDTLRVFHDLVG